MNPFKRDGGIMNCYENNEGKIIVGSKQILDNCLTCLETYSKTLNSNEVEILKTRNFPSLPPL